MVSLVGEQSGSDTLQFLKEPSNAVETTYPRGEELDENRFTGSFGVPIVRGELNGVGNAQQGEENGNSLHGLIDNRTSE